MYKPKKRFNWRQVWQFRYRTYAMVIILILGPILFASGQNITPNIEEPQDQYQIISKNFIYTEYAKQAKALGNTQLASSDINKTSQEINQLLQNAGIKTGYISTQAFIDLNIPIPVNTDTKVTTNTDSQAVAPAPAQKTLNEFIQKSLNPQYTNFLRYPAYNINTPVVYSTFEDLFQKNSDGSINFNKPVDNSPIDSPIQKKLRDGVVQLAFTPQPGEVGNCYIIGHSSNYSVVKSNYNAIFKPLESKSKPGEEFIIYDKDGRELKFRVFETLKISEDDVQEAYKSYPDRRVVTLQTSILTWVGGKLKPTHRWLTRGELEI